ncbi:MAG: hypothetical protein J6Z34_04330 [Clostridia bacterium]|nr:hypothetical protein [Clostridia bacterium]
MKKIVTTFLAGIFSLALFIPAGCGNYNAEIYDNAQIYLKEEYAEENNPRNKNPEGLNDTVTKIINDYASFNNAFESFPENIDFDNKIVVLYFFTDIYAKRNCKINSIKLRGGDLKILINHKRAVSCARVKDASSPTLRCLAVIMDKIEIDTVDFIINY